MKTTQTITELLKQKESQNLEYKESFGKETIETITAFSNTSGGIIIIRGDIEKFGTGFHRIRKELTNYKDLAFEFESDSASGFTKASLMQKKQDTPQDTLQDTPQDTLQDKMHIKLQIENLLNILDGEMSREEIQKR